MTKLVASLSADVVRYSLGALAAVVVGAVDVFTGHHFGTGIDTSLVVLGLAGLGIHVSDVASSTGSTLPK